MIATYSAASESKESPHGALVNPNDAWRSIKPNAMIPFIDENTGLVRLVNEKIVLGVAALVRAKEAWIDAEMKKHLKPGEYRLMKTDPMKLAGLLNEKGFQVKEFPDRKCELWMGEKKLSEFQFVLKTGPDASLN